MNWKGFKRKRSYDHGIIEWLSWRLSGGTEENRDERQDSWCLGQDSNRELLENKSRALQLL
jgi:hypothetical protein